MTPTTRSTAAGPERRALLDGLLRRARACGEAGPLVLRGSLLLDALVSGARTPQDVDFAVRGPFDAAAAARVVEAVLATEDPGGPALALERVEVIFAETRFPGLRAVVRGGGDRFQVDLGYGDPLPAPPMLVAIEGVGEVRACTAETLWGWKLHGLVEHGRGKWRAKDLFDLWLLDARLALDPDALRAAVALAFSSRDTPLAALDDFRLRPDWGMSRGSARKWRALARRGANVPELGEAREAVRRAVARLGHSAV
jgi:hypothetical protein